MRCRSCDERVDARVPALTPANHCGPYSYHTDDDDSEPRKSMRSLSQFDADSQHDRSSNAAHNSGSPIHGARLARHVLAQNGFDRQRPDERDARCESRTNKCFREPITSHYQPQHESGRP